jgi:hypothetical protein
LDVPRDLCHGAIAACVVTLIENDEAEIVQAHETIVQALLQYVMDDHHDLISRHQLLPGTFHDGIGAAVEHGNLGGGGGDDVGDDGGGVAGGCVGDCNDASDGSSGDGNCDCDDCDGSRGSMITVVWCWW